MRFPQIIFVIAIISALFYACSGHPDTRLLQGTWKVDSIYNFYNGYGMSMKGSDEQPLIRYAPDGKFSMIRGKEERFFNYALPGGDTLVHANDRGQETGKFIIIRLTPTQLVLRKDKDPLFEAGRQERYELRFFSRIDSLKSQP